MAQQTVPLYTVSSADRVEQARSSLAEALADAKLGDADDAGSFDVSIDAESPEEARRLVEEALARAGTGNDFVIRETTEGREIPADDPRQAPGAGVAATEGEEEAGERPSDRSARVADAASAVAAAAEAARSGDTDAAKEALSDAAGSARDAARAAAGDAAPQDSSFWKQLAPIGGLLLLLALMRRRRRR